MVSSAINTPVIARPTTTISTNAQGQRVQPTCVELCLLPDGSISTKQGYYTYDRQQTGIDKQL